MKKVIAFIITLIIIMGLSSCGKVEAPTTPSESAGSAGEYETIFYVINGEEKPVMGYYDIEDVFNSWYVEQDGEDTVFFIYGTDEITKEILETRTESEAIIIERVVGMVTNKSNPGDGIILNTENSDYNYISYSSVDFATCDGTIILTYFVYNPGTNDIDDIMERYDFVLDREYEDWRKII